MGEIATDGGARSAAMIASRPRPTGPRRTPFPMAKNARRAPAGSSREAAALPPTPPQKNHDVFSNPAGGRNYVIEFVIPEFAFNCPLSGQPDFAQFTI